jgi:hypothetical protein
MQALMSTQDLLMLRPLHWNKRSKDWTMTSSFKLLDAGADPSVFYQGGYVSVPSALERAIKENAMAIFNLLRKAGKLLNFKSSPRGVLPVAITGVIFLLSKSYWNRVPM